MIPQVHAQSDWKESFKLSEKSWLKRSVRWLIDLQNNTGLVRQSCIVILDIIVLVDRIFSEFPKVIGKAAFFALNMMGLMYIGEILQEILKSLGDVSLSILHLEVRGIALSILKTAVKITDLSLLIGCCVTSSISLLGYNEKTKYFFALMNPYSIASYIVGMGLTVGDLYINTALITELKVVPAERRQIISELFCSFVLNPFNPQASHSEAGLAIRSIRQLSSYDIKTFSKKMQMDLQGWEPEKPLSSEQAAAIAAYYPQIISSLENLLWHKSGDIILIIIGYVAMGIQKCFQNDTIIHSATNTAIALLWWVKSAMMYLKNG